MHTSNFARSARSALYLFATVGITLLNVASAKAATSAPVAEVGAGQPTTPATATAAGGRIFYVSPQGSDLWRGEQPDPGEGGAGPLRTIQRAANRAKPGDTIVIRGGDYDLTRGDYPSSVIHFASSGQPGRPITVEAYGDEVVALHTSPSRAVFDFTSVWGHRSAGFGHYVFRKLKITGGRAGWMFVPPAPTQRKAATRGARAPARSSTAPAQPVETATIPAESAGTVNLEALWAGQVHDVLIEDCEVDGRGKIDTAIYCRNAGVRNLTVRRCNFHHTVGTEGTVDIGEYKSADPAHAVPRSASHDLLFEDCDFHHSQHRQSDGIVTQPTVFNVTLRRCRAWNNGKYGFALKGSGNFSLDRCAAWGNNSSQMYCRGFGTDTGAPRPAATSDFLMTNCIFVAPADQRGGSALNWRENCNIAAYHCTIVGLRKASLKQAGGFAFLLGEEPEVPVRAVLRNCIVVGMNDSPVLRLHVAGEQPFVPNVAYDGDTNLFYCTADAAFRYQSFTWTDLADWQAFWAKGVPDGDDAARGPKATHADRHSRFADPKFLRLDPAEAPLSREWTAQLNAPANHTDVRITADSPALRLGENLSRLGIPELGHDYSGEPRPVDGPWTAGAFEKPQP